MKKISPGTTLAAALLLALATHPACALDPTESDLPASDEVDVDNGHLARVGDEIDIFDQATRHFRRMVIHDVRRSGTKVEIEAYDPESDETRTVILRN